MKNLPVLAVLMTLTVSPALAQTAPAIPAFVEETATSGVDSVYAGEWQYMVGGGIAAFDCNGDGFDDMLLAGGASPAKFYVNTSTRGGGLTFKPQVSGLELEQMTGAYPVDIDSDGNMDVVLLRVGENALMRGRGGCQFERANEAWGFDGGDGWSTAFSATWEHGARWPTLAIGNYIDRENELEPWGSCTGNWLHRPDGQAAKFAAPTALTPSYCPLSILFTDWNRSGTQSLRMSNDREYYEGGQEQMWKVEPGKVPALYTAAEGWKYLRIWGMGIASADITRDGYPDYFLTSMADSKLQTVGDVPAGGKPLPSFKDIAFAKGVTAHRPYTGDDLRPSTGWHAQFADVNNDGLEDLFVAKGNVAEMPDFAMKDPNNLLLQTSDGKFIEAAHTAGVASVATSRGAALSDLNLDGLVDLVVVNRHEKAQVWRNTSTNAGHWLGVKVQQDGPNRSAIGGWLELRRGDQAVQQEITSGGGHVSGQAGWIHLGLGTYDSAQLRVKWPGGDWSKPYAVSANQFVILERDSDDATVWAPRP